LFLFFSFIFRDPQSLHVDKHKLELVTLSRDNKISAYAAVTAPNLFHLEKEHALSQLIQGENYKYTP